MLPIPRSAMLLGLTLLACAKQSPSTSPEPRDATMEPMPVDARFLEPDAWLRSRAASHTRIYGPAEVQPLTVTGRPALDRR